MKNLNKCLSLGLFVAFSMIFFSCKKVKPEVSPEEKSIYINLLHSGTTENLRSVRFFDANTGFALGASGSLYKTINAGLTWVKSIPVVQDTSKTLVDTNMVYTRMYFVNNQIGWITGTFNAKATATATNATARKTALLKTVDGGATWKNMNFNSDIKTFNDIEFFDESNGYVVGNSGLIYRTFNGGATWVKQESGVTSNLRDIAILGSSTAMVIGPNGVLLKTDDGGVTWEIKSTPAKRAFYKIKAVSNNIIYLTGGGEGNTPNADKAFVYKIDAQGNFKEITNSEYSVFYFYGIESLNKGNEIWTVGHLGQIFRSIDGGISWSEELSKSLRQETLYDISFPTSRIGYFVGNGGVILKVDLDKE